MLRYPLDFSVVLLNLNFCSISHFVRFLSGLRISLAASKRPHTTLFSLVVLELSTTVLNEAGSLK